MGNHAAAIADFNRALEINPQFAAAYFNRGIYQKLAWATMQPLSPTYDRALEINPQFTEAYIGRGASPKAQYGRLCKKPQPRILTTR